MECTSELDGRFDKAYSKCYRIAGTVNWEVPFPYPCVRKNVIFTRGLMLFAKSIESINFGTIYDRTR